jgi:hypothetical protein
VNTINVSFVDLSGLDRIGFTFLLAMRDLDAALDPQWHLRMSLGASPAPPPFAVLPVGGGLIAIVRKPA